jgi:hypothetical protein
LVYQLSINCATRTPEALGNDNAVHTGAEAETICCVCGRHNAMKHFTVPELTSRDEAVDAHTWLMISISSHLASAVRLSYRNSHHDHCEPRYYGLSQNYLTTVDAHVDYHHYTLNFGCVTCFDKELRKIQTYDLECAGHFRNLSFGRVWIMDRGVRPVAASQGARRNDGHVAAQYSGYHISTVHCFSTLKLLAFELSNNGAIRCM